MTLQIHPMDKKGIYARLVQEPQHSPNQEWLSCIVASWSIGESVLPDCLGLERLDFMAFNRYFFPDYRLPIRALSGAKIDVSRMPEQQDLINLLKQYSRPHVLETNWIIAILVAGCFGNDHLWHDLGLWSRKQLTDLLQYNFPDLAAKNVYDMKWKKFIYKQLCETNGLYLCRVPSCEFCVDYLNCHESEEELD
jgi:nitrogen fixation protein NifQ